jgi:hypothetical protein
LQIKYTARIRQAEKNGNGHPSFSPSSREGPAGKNASACQALLEKFVSVIGRKLEARIT